MHPTYQTILSINNTIYLVNVTYLVGHLNFFTFIFFDRYLIIFMNLEKNQIDLKFKTGGALLFFN
jgi:hypothetical protein